MELSDNLSNFQIAINTCINFVILFSAYAADLLLAGNDFDNRPFFDYFETINF